MTDINRPGPERSRTSRTELSMEVRGRPFNISIGSNAEVEAKGGRSVSS